MARPKKAAVTAAPEAAAETVKAKKTVRKSVKSENIYLQTGGSEWNLSECRERVVAAYTAEGHKASGIKAMDIYIKPEEGKAYYVIDGENGSIDL
ncbi:MAG: hypothetical protein K2O18_02985 [Oscillospiraceae bacterium]|nr:hypothetical protein [Oscillospiraceae bacterium]